jgi:hypothetical protein
MSVTLIWDRSHCCRGYCGCYRLHMLRVRCPDLGAAGRPLRLLLPVVPLLVVLDCCC